MKNRVKESLKRTFIYRVVYFLRQRRNEKLENERKRREIESWELTGRLVPPPHAYKQKIVREYGKNFSADVLVETGTYLGDMIEANRKHFKKIYSIELGNALFQRAQDKFGKYRHIHLYEGDSGDILPKILSEINASAIFWLDAHYSEGITVKGTMETPILHELASIFSHKISNHVILIDDARCFTGERDYPTLSQLEQFIHEKRPDISFEVQDDVIRIHPFKQ